MNICTRILFGLAAGLLVLGTAGIAQERGAGAKSNDCDLKTLEKGKYCAKCDKLLEKDDCDKDGKCKTCSEKPVEVEVCVKKFYAADCHPDKTSDKPGTWWGKKTAEKVDKARVAFKCSGCQAVCVAEKDFKHNEGCKKKDVKKCCTKSGTKPHAPAGK